MNGSRKLIDIVLAAYRTFGVNIVGDMDPGASGEMGAIDRIAPSLQLIHSPENQAHRSRRAGDRAGVGLEAVGRAYAKIIDEANTLDREALLPARPPSTGR